MEPATENDASSALLTSTMIKNEVVMLWRHVLPLAMDPWESFSTQRHGGKPKEGNPRIQRIGRERSVALRIKSGKKPRLELQVKIVKYLLFLLGEPRKFNEIIGIKSNLSN